MTLSDQFLSFVSQLLKERLKFSDCCQQEKIGIQLSIYGIFERNFDLGIIYHEILDYLEEDTDFSDLLPEIERYYFNNIKQNA